MKSGLCAVKLDARCAIEVRAQDLDPGPYLARLGHCHYEWREAHIQLEDCAVAGGAVVRAGTAEIRRSIEVAVRCLKKWRVGLCTVSCRSSLSRPRSRSSTGAPPASVR